MFTGTTAHDLVGVMQVVALTGSIVFDPWFTVCVTAPEVLPEKSASPA